MVTSTITPRTIDDGNVEEMVEMYCVCGVNGDDVVVVVVVVVVCVVVDCGVFELPDMVSNCGIVVGGGCCGGDGGC